MSLNEIAQHLVRQGIINQDDAFSLHQTAIDAGRSFLQQAFVQGICSQTLLLAASKAFGIPCFDLTCFSPEHIPKELVSNKLIRQHTVLPLFRRQNTLFIAVSDPSHLTFATEIQFQTGLTIELILVAHDKLIAAVNAYLEGDNEIFAQLEDEELDITTEAHNSSGHTESIDTDDDAPIVKFVNKILLDALKLEASDIHLEPYEHHFRIRYRIDGILHEILKPPLTLRQRITSRLKVMARLDISERRLPQDGSIKLKISKGHTIDFRVNTLPTIWGEKVVLRILDSSNSRLKIDEMGFTFDQRSAFEHALSRPQGMILVTGPTGSGKTVTLYTGLNILNTLERNISTIEDPVEINISGINQASVNYKVGFDFAQALRAFLRQDPDVIMVGEVRDKETADIAIKAAQTGHLVLSTLHTNSAVETLSRLDNLGVASFNLATSVNLIISQRLVRRLCNQCKQAVDHTPNSLKSLGWSSDISPAAQTITLYEPKGCKLCHQGYKGRIGIYEILVINKTISELILQSAPAKILIQAARENGYTSLREEGMQKAFEGITSVAEVLTITHEQYGS